MKIKVLISLFGIKHRLTNEEDYPLIIVEVQSGKYVEENDIVRFEDKYGRTPFNFKK